MPRHFKARAGKRFLMSDKEKLNEELEETAEETEEAAAGGVSEEEAEEEVPAENEEEAELQEEAEEEAEEAEINADLEEEIAEAKKKAKAAKKKDDDVVVIKRKSTLNTASVITMIVCTVIVVACVVFMGAKLGWFDGLKPKAKNKMTMEDYSVIEIDASEVDVDDDEVDTYIESILESESYDVEYEDGDLVEDGFIVTITYTGYIDLDEDGECEYEFDGGSDEDYELEIGSDTFIDGFEDGLIGAVIDSEASEENMVTLTLTFPDDYTGTTTDEDDEEIELAGLDVVFEVYVTAAYVTVVPELTDDFALDYSETYFTEELTTVEEFWDYTFDYIYTYYLHAAMLDALQELQTVTSYDEETEEMLVEYSAETLEYYAALYGYDADSFAALYGYDDALSYEQAEAHSYMDIGMLFDYIMDELGLTYTDEDLDTALEAYMKLNGYADTYTLDEFKEASGDTWVWLYTNVEFKYDLVLEALEDRVVLVEDEEETTSASEE